MVFPTAGEDQPRSQVNHADQQPPGIAQSCDRSTVCLQTTAGPKLAQILPRRRKGLPFGTADPAPGLGSRLCHEQHSNLRASQAAAHSPTGGHRAVPRPGAARGLPALGWRDGQSLRGLIPAGEAGKLNLGCQNPASHA